MTGTGTARQVLKDLYDIDADLTQLYSELDDIFLAVTENGERSILKIMHVGCNPQRVDLQCQAMAHLADTANELNLPRVIPANAGQAFTDFDVGGVKRLVWSLEFCPGTLLEEVTPHTDGLIRSFGHVMASLDCGLKSFTHPAMKQRHKWELTRAAASRPFVQFVSSDAAAQVDAVLRRFENTTQEKLESLPHSVIHNDANDGNVLVNDISDGDAVVDGLIDFGDISYQPTICEVAIALAYLVIDKDDPLAVCTRFLESYNGLNPLSDDEIAMLYDLILTRLAVSIAIAAERRNGDPDDQPGSQDKRPAIGALSRLADIPPEAAKSVFRQACAKSAN